MTIHDWHDPHRDICPQNIRWDGDCDCPKPKRERKSDIINRKAVRDRLLKMASTDLRKFTQVKPSTLDAISAYLDAHLRWIASLAPKRGKTI